MTQLMALRAIHIVFYLSSLLLFIALHIIPLHECNTVFLTHSSAERYLNCFQFGTIMNKTAINILVKSF